MHPGCDGGLGRGATRMKDESRGVSNVIAIDRGSLVWHSDVIATKTVFAVSREDIRYVLSIHL